MASTKCRDGAVRLRTATVTISVRAVFVVFFGHLPRLTDLVSKLCVSHFQRAQVFSIRRFEVSAHTSAVFAQFHVFDAYPAPKYTAHVCKCLPAVCRPAIAPILPKEFARVTEGEPLASFWRGYSRKNFPKAASVYVRFLGRPPRRWPWSGTSVR